MASTSKPRKRRSAFGGFVELVVTVAIAIALAFLIQAFVVKPYRIPSVSMVPTLKVGQRILVNRLSTHPKLGDVVVFHPPAGATPADPQTQANCGNPSQGYGKSQPCATPTKAESSQTFVKRVVGLPGDTLRISGGHVWRNGKEETGRYIQSCTEGAGQCTFSKTIKVPAGMYYMMGDNRGLSDDSRFWGPVPQKWIIGVAFFTYWPIDRIGTI
ncbi:MAG TPA: signal peptidase I [Solirubrobacteraceae bacterium]|nr:signal peptidase I [Solirubrobacteraceae bacterium]